jgi:hypothetical protein
MQNIYAFAGGNTGAWRILSIEAVRGASLTQAAYLDIAPAGTGAVRESAAWELRGAISNLRYATRAEVTALKKIQEPLGRPAARCAALIPIRKTAAWWELAQDERRAILEEISRHNAIGMEYLPAVARQLYHSRDLNEPFDFLTWFEYAPEHAAAFEILVTRLRTSQEWNYVEREIDIRLERI